MTLQTTDVDTLCCVSCNGELEAFPTSLNCRSCAASYPILQNVPLMTPPEKMFDRVEALRAQLNVAHLTNEMVSDAFLTSARHVYVRRGLQHEFGNLSGRFPALDEEIARRHGAASAPTPDPGSRVVAITKVLTPLFRSGEVTTRSIRFKNVSAKTLASSGEERWFVSYRLRTEAGKVVVSNGYRTPFPVALLPDHEMTIPVAFAAPGSPGTYLWDVSVVQEGVRGPDPVPALSTKIVVSEEGVKLPVTLANHTEFDFVSDIEASQHFIRLALGSDASDVLELACGLYPIATGLVPEGGRHWASDLCWPELQLAYMVHNGGPGSRDIRFVCADVDFLPFRQHSVGAVVICAALHHFPDPAAALRSARRVLRPGGKLILVREPCTANANDPALIAELTRGFNEQQFVTEEYRDIVKGAGFEIDRIQIDFAVSLKLLATSALD